MPNDFDCSLVKLDMLPELKSLFCVDKIWNLKLCEWMAPLQLSLFFRVVNVLSTLGNDKLPWSLCNRVDVTLHFLPANMVIYFSCSASQNKIALALDNKCTLGNNNILILILLMKINKLIMYKA